MRFTRLFLILLIALIVSNNNVFGQYSGGIGTSGKPYQIATTDDLIELSNTSGDWGAYFIQTADITFDADPELVDWNGDGNVDAADAAGFSPIGNNTIKFEGEYDGQEY